MNNKIRAFLFNALLIVVSTLLTVFFISVCGEIYLHYFPVSLIPATPSTLINMWLPDPDIGFINKPGFEFDAKYWWGCEEKLNSHGTRGKDFSTKKPKGTYRILGIGDSVAFGVVNCNEKTFLARLENKLNSSSNNIDFEVINAGVIGYSSLQEYLFLLKYGQYWNPDMVIVTICPNDRTCSVNPFNTANIVPTCVDVPEIPDEVKKSEKHGAVNKTVKKRTSKEYNKTVKKLTPKKHKKAVKKWSFSLADSSFYNFTAAVVKKQLLRFGWVTRNADYKVAVGKPSRDYRRFDLLSQDVGEFEIFSEIVKLCKEKHIKLIVMKIPAITDLPRKFDRNSTITDYFHKNDVGYLDFYDVIKKNLYRDKFLFLYKPELYLNNDRLHMNEQGHALVAEHLYRLVKHRIAK